MLYSVPFTVDVKAPVPTFTISYLGTPKVPVIFGKLSDKYAPTVPRLPLPCGILLLKFGTLNVDFSSRDFAFTKISNCYRI